MKRISSAIISCVRASRARMIIVTAVLGAVGLVTTTTALADEEAFVVNCGSCDTDSSSEANAAADALNAQAGDTIVLNNFNTGDTTFWHVTSVGVYKGSSVSGAPQILYMPGGGGGGITQTGTGMTSFSGNSGFFSSYSIHDATPLCLSALPCVGGGIGGP